MEGLTRRSLPRGIRTIDTPLAIVVLIRSATLSALVVSLSY